MRGNHDDACLGGLLESMNSLAREAIYWTRSQLGPAERDFLSQLPLSTVVEGCFFSHASPSQPEVWRYISGPREAKRAMATASEPLVFVGHTHRSALFYNGGDKDPCSFFPRDGVTIPLSSLRRWVCVIGAVGQSRDNLSAASYGIFDTDRSCLTIHRVPYNCNLAASKIRDAGLPERLARRLEKYSC